MSEGRTDHLAKAGSQGMVPLETSQTPGVDGPLAIPTEGQAAVLHCSLPRPPCVPAEALGSRRGAVQPRAAPALQAAPGVAVRFCHSDSTGPLATLTS